MAMDMQAIMRQAQKMQNDMNRVQEELRQTEVEGAAGGGVVKVKATCANEICGIEISPEVVDPEDVEMPLSRPGARCAAAAFVAT